MTQNSQHPEFEIEDKRLKKLINYIFGELDGVKSAPSIYDRNTELLSRHESLSKTKKILEQALDNPYFGRFNFHEDGEDIEEFYISKLEGTGLLHSPLKVIYWASPIGSVYYETNVHE